MAIIIGFWTFFSFIFFKVVMDAAFYSGISIIASLLMAITLGGIIFFSSAMYAIRLFYINANPGTQPATLLEIVIKTIGPFLLWCGAFILSSWAIIFGFSKKLNNEFNGYNGEEEFFWFCLLSSIPLITHYTMILFPTYKNTAK